MTASKCVIVDGTGTSIGHILIEESVPYKPIEPGPIYASRSVVDVNLR